jgi:hypothetical protein
MTLNDNAKVCAVHMFTAGVLRFVEDLEEHADYQYVVGIAVGILASGLFDAEEIKGWFVNYLDARQKAGEEFDAQPLCDVAEQAIDQANDYVLTRQGDLLLMESQDNE